LSSVSARGFARCATTRSSTVVTNSERIRRAASQASASRRSSLHRRRWPNRGRVEASSRRPSRSAICSTSTLQWRWRLLEISTSPHVRRSLTRQRSRYSRTSSRRCAGSTDPFAGRPAGSPCRARGQRRSARACDSRPRGTRAARPPTWRVLCTSSPSGGLTTGSRRTCGNARPWGLRLGAASGRWRSARRWSGSCARGPDRHCEDPRMNTGPGRGERVTRRRRLGGRPRHVEPRFGPVPGPRGVSLTSAPGADQHLPVALHGSDLPGPTLAKTRVVGARRFFLDFTKKPP
jgi:hypothetical protein